MEEDVARVGPRCKTDREAVEDIHLDHDRAEVYIAS